MNQHISESLVDCSVAWPPKPSRERIFRVLTTGDVRDHHAVLLRNLPSQVAVEEVADIGAVLTRLDEEPAPHLVMLAWNGSAGEDIAAIRRLHDHDATVPLLIVQEPQQPAMRDGAEGGPTTERLDTVRDAIVRLVASIESLVTGSPATPDLAAPPATQDAEQPAKRLDLRLDECRALWRGQHVNLSLTEFRVVARLASDAGSEISHRDLYDVIKSEGFVAGAGDHGYRGSVRATIKRIRQKFRQVDPDFEAIRSYPGFGYRWLPEPDGGAGERLTS